ncbi:STAS/SEC14 domain-containing protein [Rubrivirga sp. S365]|uniref:STAS/SEC14 domain-containing protein n=1 Tax=Rubrivirga litoralis TaxID=3075598 RepID=A0ABU3BNZ6_9BACT|nr:MULTISPECIES: STAS/SEC14 domain-containing protein [unclassified Rubrivirga]MDT0631022.1 STAS/SEC14 domain-containing protein [Rubrivirga sp. F394]MDT7855048.1 STAS/SEC14 domain-containing protein [Rubrivirga sp. S365]
MIERLFPPAPHVVALRVGGRVTTADVDRAKAALDGALADHDRISFLLVVDGVGFVDPAALVRDIGYGIGQVQNLPRFHRAAVVTGQGWLRAVVGAENAVLPGVEVRAFSPADRAAAEAWVSGEPPRSQPGLAWLPANRPTLVAYAVRGVLRAEDVAAFGERLDAATAAGAVDVLAVVEAAPVPGLDALGTDLAQLQLRALRVTRRYAVVGGAGWLGQAVSLMAPLLPVQVKTFAAGQEAAARAWLDEGRDDAGATRDLPALPATVADLPKADDAGGADDAGAAPPPDDLGSVPPAGTPPPLL